VGLVESNEHEAALRVLNRCLVYLLYYLLYYCTSTLVQRLTPEAVVRAQLNRCLSILALLVH
jgi:hypothetical protein